MRRSDWIWPFVLILSAAIVSFTTQVDSSSPLRAIVVFWFLLVCPGMALVRLLRLDNTAAEWSIAIGLSIALDAAVAILMLYLNAWAPQIGLRILIYISLAGAVLQFLSALGRQISAYPRPTVSSIVRSSRKAASRLYTLLRSSENYLWTILFVLFSVGLLVFLREMLR